LREGTVLYLSVVIPAYNEEPAIQSGKLDRVRDFLEAQDYTSELILVDDGSRDGTAELGASIASRVIKIEHAGKAAALTAGMNAAEGAIILMTDMDQATPIEESEKLLDSIESGSDVAIGSRGLVRKDAPISRYIMSWGQVALRTGLLGVRALDTQCGFKAFRRNPALQVLSKLVVYNPVTMGCVQGPSVTSGFDVEFLMVANRLGYSISEVPVEWSYQESRRVSLWRDSLRGVVDLGRIVGAKLGRKYPARVRRGAQSCESSYT
jgi:dolichyl-phosphate beta-glucosyltransferase